MLVSSLVRPTISFSSRKGTTFRFVPYAELVRCDEVQRCMQKRGLRHKPRMRYTSFPWTLDQSVLTAQDVYSELATSCNLIRVGSPKGKGRFLHLMSSSLLTDPQRLTTMLQNDLCRYNNWQTKHAFIAAGWSICNGSRALKEELEKILTGLGIPYTKLWGMPKEYSMNMLVSPRRNGTVLIGIKGPQDNNQPTLSIPHNHMGCKRLDSPPARKIIPTSNNWRSFFSDISILPGDSVFVGNTRVWPENKHLKQKREVSVS